MKKIKKEIIVQELFILITQQCLAKNIGDITHINLPMEELALHLHKRYELPLLSERHLYNQLKTYEKEEGISLFTKKTIANKININVLNLHQFKQLLLFNKHIKIMLSNGTLDLLDKIITKNKKEWNIYLGTGSECYYVADLLLKNTTNTINIFTSNVEIIRLYCQYESKLNNIQVYTQNSMIHKATYSLTYDNSHTDYFTETQFDAIIQSPRYIKSNHTYTIFQEEVPLKNLVVKKSKGPKIMLLTLFEFLLPQEEIYPYASLEEYDYVITPPKSSSFSIHEDFVNHLPLSLYINYFTYHIYQIKKN